MIGLTRKLEILLNHGKLEQAKQEIQNAFLPNQENEIFENNGDLKEEGVLFMIMLENTLHDGGKETVFGIIDQLPHDKKDLVKSYLEKDLISGSLKKFEQVIWKKVFTKIISDDGEKEIDEMLNNLTTEQLRKFLLEVDGDGAKSFFEAVLDGRDHVVQKTCKQLLRLSLEDQELFFVNVAQYSEEENILRRYYNYNLSSTDLNELNIPIDEHCKFEFLIPYGSQDLIKKSCSESYALENEYVSRGLVNACRLGKVDNIVAALDKEVSQQHERLRLIELMVIELGNQGVVSEYSQNLNLVISRCLDQEHQKSAQKFLTNNIFEKAQSHLDKGYLRLFQKSKMNNLPRKNLNLEEVVRAP